MLDEHKDAPFVFARFIYKPSSTWFMFLKSPIYLFYHCSSWQNDVFVVAEPGELADKFLQNVKCSYQSMLKGRRRRQFSHISNISTVADLVAFRPCFQIGIVVHRYIGRQTQVCSKRAGYMCSVYGQSRSGQVEIISKHVEIVCG